MAARLAKSKSTQQKETPGNGRRRSQERHHGYAHLSRHGDDVDVQQWDHSLFHSRRRCCNRPADCASPSPFFQVEEIKPFLPQSIQPAPDGGPGVGPHSGSEVQSVRKNSSHHRRFAFATAFETLERLGSLLGRERVNGSSCSRLLAPASACSCARGQPSR